MRKNFVFGLLSVVVGAFWTLTGYGQLTTLTEGFDTTGNSVPTPTGIFAQSQPWVNVNNSDVPNTTAFNWQQGDSGTFIWTAQSPVGSTTSFAQVSFLSTNGTILSDWLLTPVLTLEAGATFSFYTVAAKGTTFANDLQVYISTSGSSTNVGSDAQTPTGGVFTLLPGGDLNPTLAVNGYPLTQPNGWTLETFTLTSAEIGAATTGRIGLRYFIPNTATQGSGIGVDTFSFADPTVFTRTVSGNWTDTTGWTPNAVPNGTTVTAQLVNPGSGTNNVNLGGGTFTVNQLQFSGTNAGTWNVTNGTIIFDGTNPTFLNQGDSSGLVGSLPNLQLNATTTFEIDNASAATDVTGDITGTGGLIKTGNGTLTLTGANTYTGGTTISAGTLQIGNGGTTGSIAGNVTDDGTLAFDRSDSVTFGGVISGSGSVMQIGTGTTILTGTNTYSGGTTISAGTLQIGNGGTTGSITGNVTDTGVLAFDRSDSVTFGGVISGTGSVTQIGAGTTILTGTDTYSGGTTISSGTLQIGNGGTTGSITGNVTDTGVLAFDRSDSVTFGGVISGTGSVTQIGAGTTILTGTNTYSGGTTISAGTLQIGNGGTTGSITGDVTDTGVLAFDRSDSVTFAGAISGTGSVSQIGSGTTILTGTNTYSGGTTISSGTLQIGNGGTAGSITGNVTDAGVLAFDRSDSVTFAGAVSGSGSVTQIGIGTTILTGTNTYTGGTTISAGTLQVGSGGTAGSITGNVTDTGVLAFDRSDSVTFAGVISGTGSVTQIGIGTTILTGTNTYSGGTTISAGTLQIGNGGTSGSITGNVTDNGTLAFDRSDAVTIGVVVSGTGSLVQLGSGTLTLTGNNTYTGGTTVSAGTLQLGNGGTSGSITGNVTDNGTLAFDRSDAVTFGGVISGTGSLVQLGSGTLTLTGNDTYSGGTTISAGTLQLGNGGTSGSITGNVSDNGVLAFDRSDSVTFAGVIAGAGGVTQIGTGTTILTGTNTYSGGTIITAGTLEAGSAGALSQNSEFTVNSILDLHGFNSTIASLSGTGAVLNNGATVAALAVGNNNASTTFSGVLQDGTSALQLTKSGTGTLTLTGANTYSGGTTISAGTLQVGNGGATGSITGNVTDNGILAFDRSNSLTFAGAISGAGSVTQIGTGTTILTGTNTYSGGTTISSGTLQIGNGGTAGSITGNVTDAGVLAFDRSDSVTFAGAVSGSGSVTQIGIGTTILTGTNTYTGGTTISAGTLQVGSGGTAGSITGNVTDTGVLAFDRSDSVTFAGVISGTGSVTQIGIGTTILTGTNTYSGGTTISAGTLQIGNGGTSGSITGNVTDNGTLAFDRSDAVTIGVVVSGTGSLVQLGSGTLTLTGNNTYTGGTTVSAGTLQLGNGGTSGSITGNVTDNGTLAFDRSDAVTFGGVISGTGSLVQLGSGTLTLTGNDTYSGGTTISAGTLQLGNGGTSGSITGNVSDNGVLAFDRSDSVTFAGVIAGAGGVTQIGTGTTILTGTNTYSGGTIITAGTLEAGSAGALSQNSEFTVNSILDLHGFNSTIASLSGTGAVLNNGATVAALAVGNNNASTTFSGVLQDGTSALQLTKSGTGTLTLTGANTYSGGTTISAGTLQIGNGGTTGSIVGNVVDNAALVFDRSGALAFTGLISGTGTVTQNGTGTLTLSGNNTYSGGTSITGGVLSVTVDGNLGIGGLSISNGAELLTTGPSFSSAKSIALGIGGGTLASVTGTTASYSGVISGSGQLSIGDAANAGTIVLSGLNTYSGGTALNSGTLVVNSSQALGVGNVQVIGGILTADPQPINVKGNYTQSAGGTLQLQVAGANPGQYDTLNVGGNAALGGTLQLISLGFQPNAGNQLTLVTSGGTVSGQFAHFVDPFSVRPGLNTIDLIYGKQSVVLEFLNQTTPVSPVIPTVPTVPTSPSVVPPTVIATINFASFALTPNQSAAANLVDQVELDPKAADLVGFLFKEPFANLPGDFEKISPEGLTAFYEISFSNANIQKLTLESRLDDIHNGSNGFSSNMKVNGATANREDKTAVDGKTSKSVVEPVLQPGPENRWGVWVTGFGDFVNVDGDGNAKGYDFTTGGVSVGVDYRITDHLAIGVMGEYAHTWTSLKPSGDIDVDSGRGGVYATWYNHGVYFNGAIYGGHNTYESSRAGLGGLATGGTEGAEWSTFISGGYDFYFGQLTVGPIASLQYTDVGIDGFSENGSLAPLAIHSGSAESLRSDFGFRAFYQWQIGKILVEPSLKAAWEHEYKYSALPITAGFAGIPGPSATFFGPNEGHDSAIVSAGVSVQLTPAISTYVNYDGQLGRGNYDSNAVTGGVRISF